MSASLGSVTNWQVCSSAPALTVSSMEMTAACSAAVVLGVGDEDEPHAERRMEAEVIQVFLCMALPVLAHAEVHATPSGAKRNAATSRNVARYWRAVLHIAAACAVSPVRHSVS